MTKQTDHNLRTDQEYEYVQENKSIKNCCSCPYFNSIDNTVICSALTLTDNTCLILKKL